MDNWENTTVGGIIERWGGSIKTGPFGTTLKAAEYTECGVPLISVREIGYGEFRVDDKTPRVGDAVITRLPEYRLATGDIVFGRKGAVDRAAIVTPAQHGWFLGSDGIRLRLPPECDPHFVTYWISSSRIRNWLLQQSTGSTMASLNQKIIARIPVCLPPFEVQRVVAACLRLLDEKVELNRRMNETLEAMAQAIFRDWFVDFGPTRRKIDGATDPIEIMGGLVTDPDRAQRLADLFPVAFGDHGLPRGWNEGPLEETLILQRGFDLPKTARNGDTYPVIAASGVNGTHYEYKVKAPGVCTGRSGVLGNIFYVQDDFWPLNTSLYVKKFTHSTPIYAYFILQHINLVALNAGSAVPTLNRNHVHNKPTTKPPLAIIHEFSEIASLLMTRVKTAEVENRTLAATRDLLLPKLMSGEIRLRDAEAYLEAAQ